MAFRRSDRQEAFFVPGTHPFRVWGYGTTDPLEEVLSPGLLQMGSSLLQQGELIYVSARSRRSPSNGAAADEPHMALVMIGADERNASRAGGSVRLVQDFGRPERSANEARGRRPISVGRVDAAGAGQAWSRPSPRQPKQKTGARAGCVSGATAGARLARAKAGQDGSARNIRNSRPDFPTILGEGLTRH
jgi:hypothetical protein